MFKKILYIIAAILFCYSLNPMIVVTTYEGVTIAKYVMHYLHLILPLQLPFFAVLATKTKPKLQKIFSWKLWIIPMATLFMFSLASWRLDRTLTKNTYDIIGMYWSFHAIATYSLLFPTFLYLYQKRIENFSAFLLSFISLYFIGIIYEVPLLIKLSLWEGIIFRQYLPLTIAVFCLLIFRYRLSPKLKIITPSLAILCVWYLIYFVFPRQLYIIPRLVPVPILLAFALSTYAPDNKNLPVLEKIRYWINMHFRSNIVSRENLKVGKNSYWGIGTFINAYGGVTIGENTNIAPYCFIHSANHCFGDFSEPIMFQGHIKKPVVIGDNCWIGAHTIILAGVTVGNNTVIGAGSVVTKDIPANCIAFGNPCEVKHYR